MKLFALVLALGALPFAVAAIRRCIQRRRILARLTSWQVPEAPKAGQVAEQNGPSRETAALPNPCTPRRQDGPTTKRVA